MMGECARSRKWRLTRRQLRVPRTSGDAKGVVADNGGCGIPTSSNVTELGIESVSAASAMESSTHAKLPYMAMQRKMTKCNLTNEHPFV